MLEERRETLTNNFHYLMLRERSDQHSSIGDHKEPIGRIERERYRCNFGCYQVVKTNKKGGSK